MEGSYAVPVSLRHPLGRFRVLLRPDDRTSGIAIPLLVFGTLFLGLELDCPLQRILTGLVCQFGFLLRLQRLAFGANLLHDRVQFP